MISHNTSSLAVALLVLSMGGTETAASSHQRRSLMFVDRGTPKTPTTFADAAAVGDDDGTERALLPSLSTRPLPVEPASLRLGHVDNFPVGRGRDRDAADWFDYGLLQLMAFGYDYSTPAFRRAREIDPNFALAYAFEALSCCFWPLWGRDDVVAANEILDLIGDTVVADDGEALYVGAIRAHFNASVEDDVERHVRAVEELRRVVDARPDDPTASALLGLWRLSLSSELPNGGDGDRDPGEEESSSSPPSSRMAGLAEGDLESSLAVQPDHPGALHYSLHLYDHIDPDVHGKGLHAAGLYPRVAPDASHGQHMPVHILLRTGDFAGSFDADVLALEAADKTCRLYGRADDEGCDLWNLYHSLEFLHVEGYHCGRWDEALGMFDRMEENYRSAARKGLTEAKDLKLFWMRVRAREVLERGLIDGALLSSLRGGFDFVGYAEDRERGKGQIECPPPVEPLDAGFWSSHTESGYLLARGLCLLLVDGTVEEEESGRGTLNSRNGGAGVVDEVLKRMGQISDDYDAAGASDRTERYNALVHSVHVALIEAVRHFVDATGGGVGYDHGDVVDGEDEGKNTSKHGDHGQSLHLFREAMSNATTAEDGLREAWTASVPTVLFLSAHELHGQLLLLPPNHGAASTSGPAIVRRAEAAMEEFRAAERERGPRLTTALGMARASTVVASSSSSEMGSDGTDGDGSGPIKSPRARDHYHRAWEMMHDKSDGATLPFWDEVMSALGIDGGEIGGVKVGKGRDGGGGADDPEVVNEDAAAGKFRGGGAVGPHSSSSSSTRVVLTSWAVGSACGTALFVAARAFYRRHGGGGEERLWGARRLRSNGATRRSRSPDAAVTTFGKGLV